MEPTVEEALQEVRRRLKEMYGERLVHMVLYGSHARGDAREDSDVDVLVVLRGSFELYNEIQRLNDITLDLLIRYEVDISFHPYRETDFADRSRSFVINVNREGIEL